tara:strand:- start:5009 stop:5386 length:378 start_codon:yes stop_codon:yes gene_type:complete
MNKIILKTPLGLVNDFVSDWDRAFFNEDHSFWRRNINNSVTYKEHEDSYEYWINLAGFKKENIEASVHEGLVTVKVNKDENTDNYSFYLKDDADISTLSSKLEDGLLSISVNKEEKAKAMKIKID